MNTQFTGASELGHDEAKLLVPWLVNGSLEPGERARLLRHADTCESCRSEILTCRQLYSQLGADVVSIPDAQTSLERFRQHRMAGAEDARPQAASSLPPSISRSKRRWLARSGLMRMAVAAVVLLALLPLSLHLGSLQAPQYRTLSDSQEQAAKGVGDAKLMFDAQLGAEQIDRLLATVGAQRVGKADAQGVYTIRLTGSNGATPDVSAIIAWLRQQPGVLFAEPTSGTGP